jgi:hypothetical protein
MYVALITANRSVIVFGSTMPVVEEKIPSNVVSEAVTSGYTPHRASRPIACAFSKIHPTEESLHIRFIY